MLEELQEANHHLEFLEFAAEHSDMILSTDCMHSTVSQVAQRERVRVVREWTWRFHPIDLGTRRKILSGEINWFLDGVDGVVLLDVDDGSGAIGVL
jgi:hypothetical protein